MPPPTPPTPTPPQPAAGDGYQKFPDEHQPSQPVIPPPPAPPLARPAPPAPAPVVQAPPPPAPPVSPPDSASQEQAEALIKEIYAPDLADHSAVGRRVLARKLLTVAIDTKDDPAARFVLLRDSKNLAAATGDWADALKAVDQMAGYFIIDPLNDDLEVLRQANLAEVQAIPLAHECITLSDQAAKQDKYEMAGRMASLAIQAAQRSGDPTCLAFCQATADRVRHYQEELPQFQAAMETLKTNPDDPDANLTAGKFLCFIREDWTKGLKNLAKGSDANLQAMAANDLKNPDQAKDQTIVADAWWDLAAADLTDQLPLQRRAATWYGKALPQLAGLKKVIAEKRVGEAGQPQGKAQPDGGQ